MNQSIETLRGLAKRFRPYALQLHGDESPELVRELAQSGIRVWKAIHGDALSLLQQAQSYKEAGADSLLVDAREVGTNGTVYGGTGKVADWDGAHALVEAGFRVVLAGGLSPHNVQKAILDVHPFGVDCVSGVESRKGVKDANLVRQFVRDARRAAR